MDTFSDNEKEILSFWEREQIISKFNESSINEKIFVDGPPFATGTMHYGHTLVSTIKDSLIRYNTMKGYYVSRKSGLDCHGVPMENLAKDILSKDDKSFTVEKYGIDKYNSKCRELVEECTEKWDVDFAKIGRWTTDKYFTMDKNYMESVIWIFSQLYQKGLIYKGYTVLPYSVGCQTPLSNFESQQNYKDVTDKAATMMFKIKQLKIKNISIDNLYVLIWTTTPWSLSANMAICTTNGGTSVIFHNTDKNLHLISSLHYYEINCSKFPIIHQFPSSDLVGSTYQGYYDDDFDRRIIVDTVSNFVDEKSGTGYVHIAPAHGVDDLRVCRQENITHICHINDSGHFTTGQYTGKLFYNVAEKVLKDLSKFVYKSENYKHSYPHCDRTNTPILYKIGNAWFFKTSSLKERMIEINDKINWNPSSFKNSNMKKWLESSTGDWCISRTRYWGTPLPVWSSEDGQEIVVISSVQELEEMTGSTINDLHIESIDHLTIKSKLGKGLLKRVPEVLDCWFESGSAICAQNHYPFENKSKLDERIKSSDYLVDFITESTDQCRGWFYVQIALMTALFNKAPFKNVIVSGLILAKDGQKMSKSKKNYTDPKELINLYGADALRLYLLSIPVVKGESARFSDSNLKDLTNKTTIKLYNILKFTKEKTIFYQSVHNELFTLKDFDYKTVTKVLNRLIVNEIVCLGKKLDEHLGLYRIDLVAKLIIDFIELFTNTYVKFSREDLKDTDKESLSTLVWTLKQFAIICAPILPFVCEKIYKEFEHKQLSVHLEQYVISDYVGDNNLLKSFEIVNETIAAIRIYRNKIKINNSIPLKEVKISFFKDEWEIAKLGLDYIKTEGNVIDVVCGDDGHLLKFIVEPTMELTFLAKQKGWNVNEFKSKLKTLNSNEITNLFNGTLVMNELLVTEFDVKIESTNDRNSVHIMSHSKMLYEFDSNFDSTMEEAYLLRLINKEINQHRKQIKYNPWDKLTYSCNTTLKIKSFIESHLDDILDKYNTQLTFVTDKQGFTEHRIIDDNFYLKSIKLE